MNRSDAFGPVADKCAWRSHCFLIADHLARCDAACFARSGLHKLDYFVKPPLSDDLGDVPDSYQPGHGFTLSWSPLYESKRVFPPFCNPEKFDDDLPWAFVKIARPSGHVEVVCQCDKPTPHPFLLDRLCEAYRRAFTPHDPFGIRAGDLGPATPV
ncbi:13.3 kDa [Guinea pig adenovirus 1]|uniref:13.3 kDa n=1 Tax=Guinea pig adenovirus 1 TaxID=2847100 RepID=A0AC61M047_9ADEN|nr:13.3 kDa [Guinea pig adenovirus]QIZ64169.1 13.3 kDa [Guinea pig adenovirus 1]QIZ64201.1 13.3 kDa [Guinea pig adenovirus]